MKCPCCCCLFAIDTRRLSVCNEKFNFRIIGRNLRTHEGKQICTATPDGKWKCPKTEARRLENYAKINIEWREGPAEDNNNKKTEWKAHTHPHTPTQSKKCDKNKCVFFFFFVLRVLFRLLFLLDVLVISSPRWLSIIPQKKKHPPRILAGLND